MFHNDLTRRQMLVRAAATAAGLGLAVTMSAASRRARAEVNPEPDEAKDNDTLNALLTAEYDAIATYTAGAGIIAADTATPEATRKVVTDVAVHFQSQHQAHAAALKALIEQNQGEPVADPETAKLPESFDEMTTTGVLKLAADKEKQAAVAYAEVMKTISTSSAAKLVAAIGAVETQHFVVLYLLVEGLIEASEGTAMNPTLVVPAAFVLDVGAKGTTNLENFKALDDLLELDPPA
jgi:rubrerythrin